MGVNEKHVAVAPGSAFGMDGFIRIAYAADIEDIMEGLRRIRAEMGGPREQEMGSLALGAGPHASHLALWPQFPHL